MGVLENGERTRAWVLVQAEDPEAAAEQIMSLDSGEDNLVVVRIDLVDGGPGNLVASIDSDAGYYEQAVSDLESIEGIENIWFYTTATHFPDPPHDASGFITEDEATRGEKEDVTPGRQDNSPGFNPWG